MTWAPFPIAGGCYKDDTLPWSAQDTVNWIPVVAEVQGTRTPIMLRGAPGLAAVAHPGTLLSGINLDGSRKAGVVTRGAYNADGVFVIVQGNTLYRYNGDWTDPTLIGTVPGVGRCSITHNQITGGSQIVIANGTAGYVYNTADGTFAQITDDGFPGAKSVDYIDSYIVGVAPGGRYWFNSDLADATSYNTLNRYEAEAEPDKIVGLVTSHSEVIVFGERTMEFFYDSGANTTTFKRRNGTQTEVGAASQFAIVKLDNTVYWLGNDGLIYRLDGYTPVRISRQPIEQQIARSDLSKCFAMMYEDRGHKIVYFTFPDGLTWGYDVATQEWHRRKSYGLKRWRANTLTKWGANWYAGDYTNGSLCTLEWGVNTENGAPLVAERVAPVLASDFNRFRLNAVEVGIDSQQSAPQRSFALEIDGNLPDGGVGDPVDYQYQIIAGNVPASVSITSGALPTGVSMDGNGHLSGTMVASGSYTWTVTVTDAKGATATLDDSATVSQLLAALFDGATGLLSAPLAAPVLGSQDFTIQARISPNQSGTQGIFSARSPNTGSTGWALEKAPTVGTAEWRQSTTGVNMDSTSNLAGGAVIPVNQMSHIAVTRGGDVFKLWVNGTQVDTKTITGPITESNTEIGIGTSYASLLENLFDGYMDWIAVHIGKCLYTDTFDAPIKPPTSASILLAFDEPIGTTTFTDTGTLGLSWTTAGSVTIAGYPYE